MIDYFSGIDTEGGRGRHYGFCHRRHAVMIFFFKGQVKSSILHNTRDRSEFRTICNFSRRIWALDRVGGGRGGIPGLHTCLL